MSAPSVVVAPGVAVTAEMTPTERHNAIARAMGAQTVERPIAPPQWHTPATVQRLAQGDREAEAASNPAAAQAQASAPASSNVLEGSEAVAAIQQMQAGMDGSTRRITDGVVQAAIKEVLEKGARVERLPDGSVRTLLPGENPTPIRHQASTPTQPTSVVDENLLTRLNEIYKSLSPEEREAKRATYESDLASILQGRRANESLAEFHARTAGNPGSAEPVTQPGVPGRDMKGQDAIDALQAAWRGMSAEEQAAEGADFRLMMQHVESGATLRQNPDGEFESFDSEPAGSSGHTPAEWEAGHASIADEAGFIALEQINPEGLSGYTLPRLVEGQTYHKGVFADLAAARASGVTQEQVNAFIEAQMRRDGIIQ